MNNEKKFRPVKVIAGIYCVGMAFWLLVAALILEDTATYARFTALAGAVVFIWAGVQGLNKQ